MEITVADPRKPEILELLRQHWSFAAQHTPPEDVHALDPAGLLEPAVTLFSLCEDGQVRAIGALRVWQRAAT